jgi:hypothetical protein
MPRTQPSDQVPRRLIVLEVIGTALIIIGILESLGPQLLVPDPLRFTGYGLVLIATGVALVTPLIGHLLLAPADAPSQGR